MTSGGTAGRCWVHPRVVVGDSPISGRGLITTADLQRGTVVARLDGRHVTDDELAAIIAAAEEYVDTISIDEGINMLIAPGQAIHFGNHGCDPNVWHTDASTLAARRLIVAGEELTVDYATQTDDPAFTMACNCGSPLCRGRIDGEDWRRPELRERYGDHWVPALIRRIAEVRGL